jgi:hypothetical protein
MNALALDNRLYDLTKGQITTWFKKNKGSFPKQVKLNSDKNKLESTDSNSEDVKNNDSEDVKNNDTIFKMPVNDDEYIDFLDLYSNSKKNMSNNNKLQLTNYENNGYYEIQKNDDIRVISKEDAKELIDELNPEKRAMKGGARRKSSRKIPKKKTRQNRRKSVRRTRRRRRR